MKLNEVQIDEIRKLSTEKRLSLGFAGGTPIANDMFTILDKLNIKLLEYPIESDEGMPAFSAAIMYSEEGNKKLTFIGLNTADYYDKQIFALAHELYHYYTKTGSHLSRIGEGDDSLVEAKANRFAAEFILPESELKSIIIEEFKTSSLKLLPHKTLIRFIARLHCTWWLPYHSLVKRLLEIESISNDQFEELYKIDERDPHGEYGRVGQAINKEIFLKLNTPTKNIGTSPNEIEIIIRNFEDGLIDEHTFVETLGLFDQTPDTFGYEINVSQEDIDELEAFFNAVDADED